MTYLDIAARGKNAWWRYLLSIGLALALTVAITVAILLPLVLLHALPVDIGVRMQHPAQPLLFFAANTVAFGALLLAFVAAIRVVHHKRLADIVGPWRWTSFFLGLGLWGAALVLTALLDFAIAPSGFSIGVSAETAVLALSAPVALAVQTFTEEFVFRGLITQGLLLATRRPIVASGLSGLAFGLIHIPNGALQAVNAVVFGAALSLIAIKTRSLAFGFGLHFINNLFAAVVVVSAGDVFRQSPGLFVQATPGLAGWDLATSTVALVVVAWLVLNRDIAESKTSAHDQ